MPSPYHRATTVGQLTDKGESPDGLALTLRNSTVSSGLIWGLIAVRGGAQTDHTA